MDRKDWLWVFAKAFGIYLVVEAILRLPSVLMVFSGGLGSSREAFLVFSTFCGYLILGIILLRSDRLILRLTSGPEARGS